VLKLSQGLCLYLAYSLPSDTHHFPHFFKGERPIITGDPRAVTENLVVKPPFTGFVVTGVDNKKIILFTFIQIRQWSLSSFYSRDTIIWLKWHLSTLNTFFFHVFSISSNHQRTLRVQVISEFVCPAMKACGLNCGLFANTSQRSGRQALPTV
jgi:hypothetical protein